jgi:hypothetical protein
LSIVYEHIKDERPGNTIPSMLRVLDNPLCDMIDLKKTWRIGQSTLEANLKIGINPDLQLQTHIFDLPTWNPFVDIFQVENYNLKYVIDSVMAIYKLQNDNHVQSSDLHLQYLKKDKYGEWTNRELYIESDIMLINILPKCLDQPYIEMAQYEIKTVKTYNTLYL